MTIIHFSNETDTAFAEDNFSDLIDFVCNKLHIHQDSEVSVTIVNQDSMIQLNTEWMDNPKPTDVLSFPMDELTVGEESAPSGPGVLGDIILCPEYANIQAELGGHELLTELRMLTVHSILHLLGYDHATPEEEKEMFDLQNSLFSAWATSRGKPWTAHYGQPTIEERETKF